jgi:hypothetical protein
MLLTTSPRIIQITAVTRNTPRTCHLWPFLRSQASQLRVGDRAVLHWIHWRTPITGKELVSDLDKGPVLVTTEYTVNPEQGELFMEAIHELGLIRRRDGAYWWGIFRDTEVPDVYLETFLVNSWAASASTPAGNASRSRSGAARIQLRSRGAESASPDLYVC